MTGNPAAVGTSTRRCDAVDKVTGGARYTADVRLPGMLHAKVLRSPHAHARLMSIDATRARALAGVHALLTRDELGGLSPTYGYFIKDQPVVAIDRVRYVGDVVAAVAAVDEAVALRALELIDVVYEPLPDLPDVDAALAEDAPELFEEAPPGTVPPYGTGASGHLYRMPGPYRWTHIKSSCECVMTTTTPAGSFRGFGATQSTWASESQVDMIARRLGMDPYELRIKNLKRLGEPFVPGESGIDSDLAEGLDAVAGELGYHRRGRAPHRGMGLAIGFKDGGGVNKPAQARVKVTTNGAVYVSSGTVEIGQGASTTLCQIAAEVLGVRLEQVAYAPINTDVTPFDQGTNASSGITVMGRAVLHAAEAVKAKVLEFAARQLGCEATALTLEDWAVRRGDEDPVPLPGLIMKVFGGTGFEFSGEGFFKAPNSREAPLEAPCVFWEVGWAGAEVEVDPDTGKVTVLRLVASGDVGKAINKLVCRGQDEGAAVMGLGQALFEEMRYDRGVLLNGEALDYRVPVVDDLPERFVSVTQEQGHGPGPFGAKGAGEGAMVPVAAAIANAVHDATGARITALPLSPERVFNALRSH